MSFLLYHSTTIIYCKIFEWDRPIQKMYKNSSLSNLANEITISDKEA